MTELLSNYFYIITLYFPLGVVGIYRWSIWAVKKVIGKKYRPIGENGYRNTVSIVTPVYNEDPNVFQKALESWIHNKPDEIVAVIDHTDKACIEKFKEFQEENKNSTLIITKRPGKREALADGIRVAKYDIIALVDSDTIWDPNIKNTLLFPFADPLVGGVGPRQDVLDTNTLARRLFNIHLDHRYFDEMTYLAVVADAVTCISGRTALYRKEAINDLCEELEKETFWGAKCISGDDKCITRLVQERGWKVRYQANARVLTPGTPDLLTFFKQQTRWARNSYRSDLKSLLSKWIWKKEKFLTYHMIDRFTQPFTLILGPIYFIFSIIWGHWLIAGILLSWWYVSRGIKLYPHLKHHPSDILILPFYILYTYLMATLKIYAIVTIGTQGWVTRWDKNRLQTGVGSIFRTLKATTSFLAVVSVMILLSLGVVTYKDFAAIPNNNDTVKSKEIESVIVATGPQEEPQLEEREAEKKLPYQKSFLNDSEWVKTQGARVTVENGDMKISTNNRTGASIFLSGALEWKDYIFNTRLDWNRGSHISLLSRINESGNYVACSFTDKELRIEQYLDGIKILMVKKSTFFEMPQKAFWLGIMVNKDKVECLVNGNSVIHSYDLSPALLRGGIGIKVFDPKIDNSEIIIKSVEDMGITGNGENVLAQLPKTELVIKETTKEKQKPIVAIHAKKPETVAPEPVPAPIPLTDGIGSSTPYTINDFGESINRWTNTSGGYFVKDSFLHVTSYPSASTGRMAFASTSAGRMVLRGASDWKDYSFKTIIDWSKGAKVTLIARYKDSRNYIGCTFSSYGARAVLYQVIDGAKTTLGKTPKMSVSNYTPWLDNHFGVQVKDNEMQCLIKNQWVLRYDASNMQISKNGGIGIEVWDEDPGNGEIILKEVKVESVRS